MSQSVRNASCNTCGIVRYTTGLIPELSACSKACSNSFHVSCRDVSVSESEDMISLSTLYLNSSTSYGVNSILYCFIGCSPPFSSWQVFRLRSDNTPPREHKGRYLKLRSSQSRGTTGQQLVPEPLCPLCRVTQ